MLNRLLGSGTYVSYDMRCMVTGQFAVGKSSLVKLLAGDVVPEGRHPTDGISLLEGRCGLDVETRSWIYIDPGKNIYNIKTFHLYLNSSLVSSTSLLASVIFIKDKDIEKTCGLLNEFNGNMNLTLLLGLVNIVSLMI